jgi:diguanylate cyclase (GGDEF)-like protein
MVSDGKRPGLWDKLTRGIFEFDAPLTSDLLPLLPDPATRGRRKLRPPPPGTPTGAVADVETLEIDLQDAPSQAVDGERAALVVVHGHAAGERFDLEPGTVTLGPDDDAVLTCDAGGVTLRTHGSTADVHVDFRRVSEARLEHGALIGIGGTLLKFLRCRDLDGAHIDELHRLHRHDGLTDLHHERYLRHRLRSAVSHARRHASPLALVVLDLAPRTARGAALTGLAHDFMLREVARAARGTLSDDEILGRHGPSQLALVLPGRDLEAATTRAGALHDAVTAVPVAFDGQRIAIEARIGLAVFSRDTLIHDDLLRAALAALPAAPRHASNAPGSR